MTISERKDIIDEEYCNHSEVLEKRHPINMMDEVEENISFGEINSLLL